MQLLRHLGDLPQAVHERGSVVTIGSFDGIHAGHRQLLDRVIRKSKSLGVPSIVMSFEPTPEEFLSKDHPPARLMRFREKYEALAAYGIDIFYCPRFSSKVRNIRAADFIRQVLSQGLNLRHIVVGDDFRFARRREGTVEHLQRVHRVLGFGIEQASSLVKDDIRVSSTAIRLALANGNPGRAATLLGRPYQMSGRIVRGRQVGRTLGYPTANVDLKRRLSPVMGIYAVRVTGLPEGCLDGVASIGTRPTFDLVKPLLEVHLFDFDRDIYGDYISVDFIAHLRDEVKFDSVEELVAQMDEDAENARFSLKASDA